MAPPLTFAVRPEGPDHGRVTCWHPVPSPTEIVLTVRVLHHAPASAIVSLYFQHREHGAALYRYQILT